MNFARGQQLQRKTANYTAGNAFFSQLDATLCYLIVLTVLSSLLVLF